jgi:predicted N-acyltransferase
MDSPFLEWDWLRQIEASGSASPATGWLPRHLTVRAGSRPGSPLVAAAPLYVKLHSDGEFVFDYVWAELSARLGVRYYPKLVGMTPFTPTGAYRFLVAPDQDEDRLTGLMAREIDRYCRDAGLSGVHFHYVDPAWRPVMEPHGFGAWLHPSYVWRNRGYRDFDGFLADFAAGQRKNIRKERRSMAEQGIVLRRYTGDDIPESFFPQMHRLYAEHNAKFGPWGCKFLNRAFFDGIGRTCRDRLLFIAAERAGEPEPVGLAMCAVKGDRLYGRYWGSSEEVRNLHFNACYYEPIAWAIEHGLSLFDPGIGGPHKQRRGFVSVPNVSLHRFRDERLSTLWKMYIDEINAAELEEMADTNQDLPLRAEVAAELLGPKP